MVSPSVGEPGQKSIVGCLYESLARDDPLPLMGWFGGVQVGSKNRWNSLLALQDKNLSEWSSTNKITAQRVPTEPTPTALYAASARRN